MYHPDHRARTGACGAACAAALAMSLFASVARGETVSIEVLDRGGHPVADVAVYLTPEHGAGEATSATPPAHAAMDQQDYEFVPHLLVVSTGTEVSFPNSDRVRHHVYSFAARNRFELPLYKGRTHAPVRFDHAGLVTLGCNIHDNMLGYILVVDTPHFGKTDEHGRVELEVPAGSYLATAWSPRFADPRAELQAAMNTALQSALTLTIEDKLRATRAAVHTSSVWDEYGR